MEAKQKRQKKEEDEESRLIELQELELVQHPPSEGEDEKVVDEYAPRMTEKIDREDLDTLVDCLLSNRLGEHAFLVAQHLDRPKLKRNMMPIPNTAASSLRFDVSPAATAAVATGFLKDLIKGGHLSSEKAFLACDPSKVRRARQEAMRMAKDLDDEKHEGNKIQGLGYDGRKDPMTRAMVQDKNGKSHIRMIKEEHVSVTEEPSGQYLWHFVPEDAVYPEKPALKVAQAIYDLLVAHDSTDSLRVLAGDSTNMNTGWKGGTHALVENLVGHKLYWAICMLHTNELVLRHLIVGLDGPTSSGTGFSGPVCKLLSKVNQMEYNPNFHALPGGEDLIKIPDSILSTMSTDQQLSYKLVQAVKSGNLPPELQEVQCGLISHARFLTTAENLVYMWTRHHGLIDQDLKTLEILVCFCIEMYFKLYYDIKVQHKLQDGPYHILTQLRILKTQPKKVRDIATFYVRTGAWFAHWECVLLSLVASSKEDDRKFAVMQILKLRGNNEYGDTSVRPRIHPKMNLSATSLQNLIPWTPGQVHEPIFTCYLSKEEIKKIEDTAFEVPIFSIHTQSTERAVKQVTEAAAAVVGQQARDGFVRARAQHREIMPSFKSKKDIMAIF